MKIVVFSDSHGKLEAMKQVTKKENPDRIFHLGDCERDAARLHSFFPDIPLDGVPGNCDFGDSPHTKLLIINGKKIMLTHGHDFNVKASFLRIAYEAQERGADAVFFGHTHRAFYENNNGVLLFNPGSVGEPRYGTQASYGVLEIEEDGSFHVETRIVGTF